MNYTKTGFSYILWGIYTLLICTLLTLGVLGITADYGMTDMTYRILCAGVFFLLLFGLSFLLYSLFGQFMNEKHRKNPDVTAIELIAATTVFLFIGAFALRRLLVSITAGAGVLQGDRQYFELAMLTKQSTAIPWHEHVAAYIFTWALRGMCMLFGNIEMSVVLLQVLLLLMTVIFLYFAVRNMLGKLAAFCTITGIAALPAFMNKLYTATAELLILCCVSLVLFVLSLLMKLVSRDKIRSFAWCIVFLLFGMLTAGLTYLDIVGTAVFLMSVIGILSIAHDKDNDSEGAAKRALIQNHALQVLFITLGMAAGLIILFGIRIYLMPEHWFDVLLRYASIYIGNWQGLSGIAYFITDMSIVEYASLYILAAFLITGFWFVKKDKACTVILFTAGAFVLQFGIHNDTPYNGIWKLALLLSASLGIQTMADYRAQKYAEAENTESGEAAEAESAAMAEAENLKEAVETAPEQPEAPRLIENPLPLPKKHVPKTMDYAVNADDSDYDIVVDENDDFDI